MPDLHEDLHTEMNPHVRKDLCTEMKPALCEDLRTECKDLRTECEDLRTECEDLRTQMNPATAVVISMRDSMSLVAWPAVPEVMPVSDEDPEMASAWPFALMPMTGASCAGSWEAWLFALMPTSGAS